jgi:hypothetical protein
MSMLRITKNRGESSQIIKITEQGISVSGSEFLQYIIEKSLGAQNFVPVTFSGVD